MHGAMAILRKLHRLYGSAMLAVRSLLSVCKALLLGSEATIPAIVALDRKIADLERRQPQKAGAHQMYLKQSLEDLWSIREDFGGVTREEKDRVFAEAWGRLEALPEAEQKAIQRDARAAALQKQMEINEELLEKKAERMKLVEEERIRDEGISGIARLGQARSDQDQVEQLYTTYKAVEGMTEAAVENARAKETLPPSPPPHEECVRIANYNIGDLPREPEACLWVKMFCWNRFILESCVLLGTGERGGSWLWLYGVKSPIYGVVVRIARAPADLATGVQQEGTCSRSGFVCCVREG